MDPQLSSHATKFPLGWMIALAVAGATVGTLVVAGPAGPPLAPPTASPGRSAPCSATPSATTPPAAETVAPSASVEPSPTGSSTSSPTSTPTSATTPTPTTLPTPTLTPTLTPTARPTPTVRPTPPPTPRPTGAPASVLVRHGSRTGNEVALTFDMGGRVGDALPIVNWLVEHDVHATIFMTGAIADSPNTDAGRRVLAIIDANPNLFTLGNHSYTHRDFRKLTAAEIRDELRRTEAALAPYCGQDPRPFFRPPSGGYDAAALAAIGAAGYRYTVLWDVDTIDWRPIVNDPPGPTADQIVAKVLGNAQAGSIVLMHLGGYETLEALPRVVQGLRDAGFHLVTLDELL